MSASVDDIREVILRTKRPSYQTTNKKEVRIRCPYCGDSRRDLSAAHLYIEMNPPFRFHCFKCETSGVLNSQTLRDMEIFDSSLNTSLISVNKSFRASQGVQKVSVAKKRSLNNTTTNTNFTLNNLGYFNNRYNTNFDAKIVTEKFKAVLDAESFFTENKLFPGRYYDFANSIGFISSDNSHIVFRDITGYQKQRYYNLNLDPMGDESISGKIYSIHTQVDALKPRVKLVMTEGIFDIIGVYTHFYMNTAEEENTIFAAACGKGFNACILNYIRNGFLDLDIVIYSDADVDVSFYKSMKANSPYLKNSKITVFYNSLYNKQTGFGKDYGVPKDQIKLRKVII